jgi:acetyl esterase
VKSQAGMPPTLVLTASLDPIRDQGRAYAAACVQAGVPTVFREADGNIHGFINLRKAIPSSEEDVRGCVEGAEAHDLGGEPDDRSCGPPLPARRRSDADQS